jgi:hypothetical protein
MLVTEATFASRVPLAGPGRSRARSTWWRRIAPQARLRCSATPGRPMMLANCCP